MQGIHWQAHRGGGAREAPDNTMAADLYAWSLGGIPEADIRRTKEGAIICLHDNTLARTTTAPEGVRETPVALLTLDEVRKWDAGVGFNESYSGEHVPLLSEVFEAMSGRSERMIYLDLKDADLDALGAIIDRYGVNRQVIFAHNRQASCIQMKKIAVGVRTMLWISGDPGNIERQFTAALENGFTGLDQVQFHLRPSKDTPSRRSSSPEIQWPYELKRSFVESALEMMSETGPDLEVFPFDFDESSIYMLLDMGIRWFATDEPKRFAACARSWWNRG